MASIFLIFIYNTKLNLQNASPRWPPRGQYYYRFGSIHANIIGMEVVLADGTILGKCFVGDLNDLKLICEI